MIFVIASTNLHGLYKFDQILEAFNLFFAPLRSTSLIQISKLLTTCLYMKRQRELLALLCFFFIALGQISAQNPNRISLKGMVYDTAGQSLPFATVMLLSPKDSTLLSFTRADENAAFEFKRLKNEAYLLKVSYIGYLPYQQHVDPSTSEVNDVGRLQMKLITKELLEVVVKAARSTLSIRGDTIEYDASSFKVPPGSTVEDLLRRLPGIELDADGNIKAQGRDVKRLYVDGKTFFGDDPKMATKNLGAETISKVQVYNEKSEQSKLTGVDDGKKEKAMNLELKEEFKKGAFGKLTAGVGTEDRWTTRGNYNRFNSKEQLSFIGFANNVNQTGVNWEDYGEFKGENAYGDYDNGDFGFSNGGGRYYYMYSEGGGEGLQNHFDGRGFTQNGGAGVNYNFNNKKTKFNASYSMNQTQLDLQQFSEQQTFLRDSSFSNTDTLTQSEFRRFHGVSTRIEHEIDSNNVLIVKLGGRVGDRNSNFIKTQKFSNELDLLTNSLDLDNDTKMDSWKINSTVIYRHRFAKKGRSFAISGGYNNNQTDNNDTNASLNQWYGVTPFSDPIRQLNLRSVNGQETKSSLLYTEPLTKSLFWESFYNFTQNKNRSDQQVNDLEANSERIESLSIYFDNNVVFNRLGSSLRYSKNGLNSSLGVAAQRLHLHGEYAREKGGTALSEPIDRIYDNITPNISFGYEFPNNLNVETDYSYNVQQPQLNDLQPAPNVTNPAFRREGNPSLQPSLSHSLSANLNYWNPAAMSNVGIGANFDMYDRQIVYNQSIEFIDSLGFRTTTTPVNINSGNRFNMYLWSGFPIVKTKLTMNINLNTNINIAPVLVNLEENDTRTETFSARPNFNFTPTKKLIFGLGGNLTFTNVKYSISDAQNQEIRNFGANSNLKWHFLGKFFLETSFDYSFFRNERIGADQSIPIWNASLRRLFGKKNRLELRLTGYDLLDKKRTINQWGSQNQVSRNSSPTLSRYIMLSASYNVRGFESKLGKNNWW
jgi:Outer membrane protein beta-barrel family/CarboxypepD_reg-like domain